MDLDLDLDAGEAEVQYEYYKNLSLAQIKQHMGLRRQDDYGMEYPCLFANIPRQRYGNSFLYVDRLFYNYSLGDVPSMTGRFVKGYGEVLFLLFEDEERRKKVIQTLNDQEFRGRKLVLREAPAREFDPNPPARDWYRPNLIHASNMYPFCHSNSDYEDSNSEYNDDSDSNYYDDSDLDEEEPNSLPNAAAATPVAETLDGSGSNGAEIGNDEKETRELECGKRSKPIDDEDHEKSHLSARGHYSDADVGALFELLEQEDALSPDLLAMELDSDIKIRKVVGEGKSKPVDDEDKTNTLEGSGSNGSEIGNDEKETRELEGG